MKRFLSLVMVVTMLLSACAFAESATATLAEMYADAELLMAQGDYTNAAAKFDAMGSYSDASQMAMYCKAIAAAETLQMFDVAIDAFNKLGDFKDSKQMAAYYEARKFQAAGDDFDLSDLSTLSDENIDKAKFFYEQGATKYAELALFKDCIARMAECQANTSALEAEVDKRNGEKWETENEAVYQQAISLENEGKLYEALAVYHSIDAYRDSSERIDGIEQIIEEAKSNSHIVSKHELVYVSKKVVDVHNIPDSWEITGDYTHKYIYDDDGYTIQVIDNSNDSIIITEKLTIDNDGHIVSGIKSYEFFRDSIIDGYTYDSINTYDDHNNLIKEERTYHPTSRTSRYEEGEFHIVTHEYTYDENGNILTEAYSQDGEKPNKPAFITYTYDSNGQISTYIEGLDIHYLEYDEVGLLARELIEFKEKKAGDYNQYTIIEYIYQTNAD